MKKITCFFLVLLALVFIFPVLFLVVGSLMGKNELTDLLPGSCFRNIRL